MPPIPPVEELVVPSKLFSRRLAKEPTSAQLVDSAVSRFLRKPLAADKKARWCKSLAPGR